jgi:hypothetical protein
VCSQRNSYSRGTTNIDFQAVRSGEAIMSQDQLNFDENHALDPGVGLSTTSAEALELYKNPSSSVVLKRKPAPLSIGLQLGGNTSRALQPLTTDAMKRRLDYQQAMRTPQFAAYDTEMARLKAILEASVGRSIGSAGKRQSLAKMVADTGSSDLQETLTAYKKQEGSRSTAMGRIRKRIRENYAMENAAAASPTAASSSVAPTTASSSAAPTAASFAAAPATASFAAAPTASSPSTIAAPQTSTDRLGKMKELQRPSVLLDITTTCKQFYYSAPNPSDIFAVIHKELTAEDFFTSDFVQTKEVAEDNIDDIDVGQMRAAYMWYVWSCGYC